MAVRNLLELKPKRNREWVVDEKGQALVTVPRFTNPLLVRWLVPRLSKPNFRVRLDAFGTFVWSRCDGATPVSTIAKEMLAEFGAKAEPVYDRINAFLQRLEREGLIRT